MRRKSQIGLVALAALTLAASWGVAQAQMEFLLRQRGIYDRYDVLRVRVRPAGRHCGGGVASEWEIFGSADQG